MLHTCPSCGQVLRVAEANGPERVTCVFCGQSSVALADVEPGARVTLTAAQLRLPEVEEFVVLLVNIASDGVLEYDELQKLTGWLNDHIHCDIAAIRYMVNLMLRVCADGRITEEEVFEIQLAIERVLPKQYRERVTKARQDAYYSQPASAAQLDVIEGVVHRRPPGLTRRAASEMIDNLYMNPPASNRQIMFLRFWDRLDLANRSRREISAWMDSFIQGDRARYAAWDLFKAESGDDGSQRDPSWVPIGSAEAYLDRARRELGRSGI